MFVWKVEFSKTVKFQVPTEQHRVHRELNDGRESVVDFFQDLLRFHRAEGLEILFDPFRQD